MTNVLLIEPDKLLGQIYQAALQSAGCRVAHCFDAQAAIAAADKRRPDVVVLELQLAGHSGFEFLYEFRSYADWQDIPVILNTGAPKRKFFGKFPQIVKSFGVSDYLYKPQTNLQDLLASVAAVAKVKLAR
jgi:DNA-binding response OmpR family regulator